jgi:hypothetical protein
VDDHALTLAIAFASPEAARRAIRVIRESTRAEVSLAPLGSLEYDRPSAEALIAARVPMPVAPRVRELASQLGGRVLEERAAFPEEETG